MAAYVFRVRVRLDSADPTVTVEPRHFETVLKKAAAEPGTEDWLFFRDNLWRGEVNDEKHLRELATETLGVEVESISFRELVCSQTYLDSLRREIEENLDLFRADDAGEVIHKYLGSSIRVA